MALRLFRFRRFSNQLLFLLAGLIAVVQISVYLFISEVNERNAVKHIEDNLYTGARIFHRSLDGVIRFLYRSATALSNDFQIRKLIIQDPLDRATLHSILQSYADRVRFSRNSKPPLITLFSPEGEMLAMSSDNEALGTENLEPFRHLIRRAGIRDIEETFDYTYLDGKLQVLVVLPLYAPEPIVAGWYGLAYPIDQEIAEDIKSTTLLELTFTSDPHETNHRVLYTTLSHRMAEQVLAESAKLDEIPAGTTVINLEGEPYVTLFEKIQLLGEAPVRITLQRALKSELAPARDLEKDVLVISLIAVTAATLAALWIARGVSQPLQQLANYTDFVATGDYTRKIHLPREDELGQLAIAFNHMTSGLAERDKVRDLLGKVVSPEIAAQLLKSDLKLGGEEREVTVLFCDLRNFTTLSEKMSPADLLALLNRYLDRMSTIIEKHGGVIDKYIGDAIMALFGAPIAMPDGAARAMTTARQMTDAMEELCREFVAEGKPAIAFGIGINTGLVIAGNMGSKSRLNYTVLGDGVNLASRLESLTKDRDYGTSIIVSESTARASGELPSLRPLGTVTVKGKSEAVQIFAFDIMPRPWPKKTESNPSG